jgi:hypothetical protein
MRRFAGSGIMLLALAGCQGLPAIVRIEVDGSTLEFKKKVPPAAEPAAPKPDGGAGAPTS